MKVKGVIRMVEILVPEQYRYVLDRGDFELIRSTQNLAFMISQHLADDNIDFLSSDLFNRLRKRAEETYMQRMEYVVSIAYKLLTEDRSMELPGTFSYANENRTLVY